MLTVRLLAALLQECGNVLLAMVGIVAAATAAAGAAPTSMPSADNPLRHYGAIVAPAGKRYLAHADGTPFLWIGDTAWNTAYRSTIEQWKHYIDTRAAQGFSVIQVDVIRTKGIPEPANHSGRMPFDSTGRPDSAFWQELRAKVRYANDRGLLVLLVGVGVSHQQAYHKPMLCPEFARHITSLFAEDRVVFSPSMDRAHDPRNEQMARWLKEAQPRCLVTQHPNNTLPPAMAYHRDALLDFTIYQSGHASGNADRAYEAAFNYPAALLAEGSLRPLINSEAMYDGTGCDAGESWSGRHARQLGWISMLSGSAGYTYGAGETRLGGQGGVWKLHSDEKAFDYWQRALTWPSATQVGHMARFFRELPWWRLTPAPQRILSQPSAPQARSAAAVADDGSLLVAFLPNNDTLELNLSGLRGTMTARWFNPIDAKWHSSRTNITAGGTLSLTCPHRGEWVLVLRQ